MTADRTPLLALLDAMASPEFQHAQDVTLRELRDAVAQARAARAARDARVAAGVLPPLSPDAEFFASWWTITESGARPRFPGLWEGVL